MRDVSFAMSARTQLAHSSLLEEMTSACVENALTVVMLR